jgi:hypothetical protein
LAVLASSAISLLAVKSKPSFLFASTHAIGVQAFGAVASLLSAAPYVLLFIALSLLATTDNPNTAFTAESTDETPPIAEASSHP